MSEECPGSCCCRSQRSRSGEADSWWRLYILLQYHFLLSFFSTGHCLSSFLYLGLYYLIPLRFPGHFHHMHNIVARAEAPYCIQRVISFEKVHIDRNCMFVCMVGMFLCVVRSGRWLGFKSLMRWSRASLDFIRLRGLSIRSANHSSSSGLYIHLQ